jgi:hypothetical protein
MMLRGVGRSFWAKATVAPANTASKESERTNDWLKSIFLDQLYGK